MQMLFHWALFNLFFFYFDFSHTVLVGQLFLMTAEIGASALNYCDISLHFTCNSLLLGDSVKCSTLLVVFSIIVLRSLA